MYIQHGEVTAANMVKAKHSGSEHKEKGLLYEKKNEGKQMVRWQKKREEKGRCKSTERDSHLGMARRSRMSVEWQTASKQMSVSENHSAALDSLRE